MISFALAAALAFAPADAAYAHETMREFVRACTPRDAGTVRGNLAANWILDRAGASGVDIRRDIFTAPSPDGDRRFVNLCAEFQRDPTNRWVVLVSHYDTKHGCPGANDGAATSALLIALARVLSDRTEPKENVLLVWTDAEECKGVAYAPNDGLQGSKRAVGRLKDRGLPVKAVICLDMLGDRDLHITVPANGTPTLANLAVRAASRAGLAGLVSLSELCVKDDHVPFLDAGYPAIDLIDFEYGPANGWWHTAEDTCDKVSEESLLKSGRLVCEMLNILP